MWKELLEDCDIEPTTPIDMDGLPSVKLETALRTLLAAVSGAVASYISRTFRICGQHQIAYGKQYLTGYNLS